MSINDNNRNGSVGLNTSGHRIVRANGFARTDSCARAYRWHGESGTRHQVCNANCRQGS